MLYNIVFAIYLSKQILKKQNYFTKNAIQFV